MMRSNKGFTLVETIFSTLFVSMTVLAIINLFPGAYLSIRKSEVNLQTTTIARSIVDELRDRSFSTLTPGVFVSADPVFKKTHRDGILYTPKTTIYDVPDSDPMLLRGVRVEVTYQLQNKQGTVVHETYIVSMVR